MEEARVWTNKVIEGEGLDEFKNVFLAWDNKVRLVFLKFVDEYICNGVDNNSLNLTKCEAMFINLRDKLNLNTGYNAEIWFQVCLNLNQTCCSLEPLKEFLGG